MKIIKKTSFVLVLLAAVFSGTLFAESVTKSEEMGIYELRTYYTHPGKLNDLHKRFRNHTNRIFLKHNMEAIAYWSPIQEPEASNTLIYVLKHASREAAKASWKAFVDDPEWKKVAAESERNGKIVARIESVFMNVTDYSPMQ